MSLRLQRASGPPYLHAPRPHAYNVPLELQHDVRYHRANTLREPFRIVNRIQTMSLNEDPNGGCENDCDHDYGSLVAGVRH